MSHISGVNSAIEQSEVHPLDQFHSLHNSFPQSLSVGIEKSVCISCFLLEFRSLPWPERSCDRVAPCCLDSWVSLSLIVSKG